MSNVDRETQAEAFWLHWEAYRPDHDCALERRGVRI
jgi:hypothetical protein